MPEKQPESQGAVPMGGKPVFLERPAFRTSSREDVFLSNFFEWIQEAVVMADADGRVIKINREFTKLFGFTLEEIVGKSIDTVIVPDDKLEEAVGFTRKSARGEKCSAESVRRTKNGTEILVSILASPIIVDGKILGYCCIYRDISETRLMEQAVFKKLEIERIISAVSSQFVNPEGFDEALRLSLAEVGRFTGADRSYLFVLREDGETMDEICEWCRDGVPSQMARLQGIKISRRLWMFQQLTQKDVIQIDDLSKLPQEAIEDHQHLDRQDVRAVLVIPMRSKGKLKGFFGVDQLSSPKTWREDDLAIVRIISEIVENAIDRRNAENALKETQRRYSALFDCSNDGVLIISLDGVLFSVNDRAAEMLGYSKKELIGRPIQITAAPEEYQESQAQLKTVVSGRLLPSCERTFCRKNGTRFIAEINANLVRDEKGNPLYIQSIIRDISDRKKTEQTLRENIQRQARALVGSIEAIAATIEKRDPYTAGHQKRVTELACAIATEMGLPADQIEGVRFAGLIHDIGKISIPTEILSKPGLLTPPEFELIKLHPQSGYEILKNIDFPWPVAMIVLQHHEKMDGTGYPQGLRGNAILIEARILSVADIVEAMASHRPYRPALGLDIALEEIQKNIGISYDSAVGGACLKIFKEKGYIIPTQLAK